MRISILHVMICFSSQTVHVPFCLWKLISQALLHILLTERARKGRALFPEPVSVHFRVRQEQEEAEEPGWWMQAASRHGLHGVAIGTMFLSQCYLKFAFLWPMIKGIPAKTLCYLKVGVASLWYMQISSLHHQ